jgi:hypothetical protein
MRKRTDSTAAERYSRWAERARHTGRRRMTLWLPAEVIARLQELAQAHGLSLAQTVAKVILERGQTRRSKDRSAATGAIPAKRPKSVSANVQGLSPEVQALVLGWRSECASWAECARRLDRRGIEPPRGGLWLQERGQTNLARYFRD